MSRDFTPLLVRPHDWWQDTGEISRLLRWLRDGDGLELADAISIVEKPWHWDDEYQQMCREQEDPGVARDQMKLSLSEET